LKVYPLQLLTSQPESFFERVIFSFSGTKGQSYELFGSADKVGSLPSLFLILEDDVRGLLLAAGLVLLRANKSTLEVISSTVPS